MIRHRCCTFWKKWNITANWISCSISILALTEVDLSESGSQAVGAFSLLRFWIVKRNSQNIKSKTRLEYLCRWQAELRACVYCCWRHGQVIISQGWPTIWPIHALQYAVFAYLYGPSLICFWEHFSMELHRPGMSSDIACQPYSQFIG